MPPVPRGPGQPSAGVLTDHLLVQAEPGDIHDVLHLAERDGAGIVVTGEQAIASCQMGWRNAFPQPLLVDRRRYSGARRKRGTDPLTDSWLAAQEAAGTAAILSDSGYIGEDDDESLASVLDQCSRIGGQVIAVLPLHVSWLGKGLKRLAAEVNDHGVPVTLVLEHKSDPLGTQQAVRGLTWLLSQAAVPVSLLCCDISGIGAIAFGAAWSAVGVHSRLRHLYPADSGGYNHGPSVSALVRPMLTIVTVEKIAEAWAETHDDADWVHDIWTCPCLACRNRTMDWLATASEAEVNAHTFEILAELREGLSGLTDDCDRQRSWISKCKSAIFRYEQMRAELRVGWRIPGYLRSWAAQTTG